MSTWKELHDDYLQKLSLYAENIRITPQQVMRELTAGMQEFQRRVQIVEDEKTLTVVGGGDVTLDTTPWPCTRDWLEIHSITDNQNERLLLLTWQQFKDMIDMSRTDSYGYHSAVQSFATTRDREDIPNDRWQKTNLKGMPRICTIWEENFYRYPAVDTDTTFVVRYIANLDIFSQMSTQWAAWFVSETAFNTLFASTGPNSQIAKYEKAFVHYAVAEFFKDKNVLVGEGPVYQAHESSYEKIVAEALENKPTLFHEGQAPFYGLTLPRHL